MKHILRSAFSLAAAGTMAMSTGAFNVYAEEITAVYGEAEITDELYFADADTLSLSLPEMPAIEANYSVGTYNYGTSLDENNVAVYVEFMKLINPSVEPIQIDFPEPVTFTASSYSLTRISRHLLMRYFQTASRAWTALLSICLSFSGSTFQIPVSIRIT